MLLLAPYGRSAATKLEKGCNNDRLFPEKNTVKDYISNTKLEKGHHYYIQTRHKDLFSHYNLKIQTKCAHGPWASYNTP